jgi:hypothetical protein
LCGIIEIALKSRINELIELLPPPEGVRNTTGDWELVEKDLGIRLPDDFKAFTELYGSVKICDCLFIHTPFPWDEGARAFQLSLCQQFDRVVAGRKNVPFSNFPALGGLLGFGGTDNGDIVSWITEGEPNDWGIFFWNFPGLETFTFRELNLSGFLVELLTLTSPLFPNTMPDNFFTPEERRIDVTY